MDHDEKIAIYSRKSKFTGKGDSIGNQVELCRDYIRHLYGEQRANSCEVFEDEGFSGGNLNRPAFRMMMEQVRKGNFKAIVVYRLDRISRNISDFTGLIEELTKRGVSFVSIREQFDTATPMGRAMMFIISVFSQLERETIAERIRDNMHELAKTGRWLGGNSPTGYRSEVISDVTLDGKKRKACKLIPVEEEAEIVRTIFDLYIQTDSLTAVEAELLRRRLKTKKGNHFTRFSIKGILQNPVYAIADADTYEYFAKEQVQFCSEPEAFDGKSGMMVYNRTDQEKGSTAKLLPMTEWIVAVGKHPGLIAAKQWIMVQQSLERNKSKTYRKARTNEALLTGHLFCECGGRMYPKLSQRLTAEGKPIYTYVCKMKERSKGTLCHGKNAKGNILDVAVLEQVKLLPQNHHAFISHIEKSRQNIIGSQERSESQMGILRRELEDNEKIIESLIDSLVFAEDAASKTRVIKRIEQLSESSRQLEARMEELVVQKSAYAVSSEEFNIQRDRLSIFSKSVGLMNVEEKRTAIRALIRKVIWDGECAHVVFSGAEGDAGLAAETTDFGRKAVAGEMLWREDSK